MKDLLLRTDKEGSKQAKVIGLGNMLDSMGSSRKHVSYAISKIREWMPSTNAPNAPR
jgi:hypothetical protein